MELTRRDAVAALAAGGVGVGAGMAAREFRDGHDSGEGENGFDEQDLETLVALAGVLYPSEVDGVEPFVREYATGRADARPAHARSVQEALAELDEHAVSWYGGAYVELDGPTRERLLRELGCDTADPDPEGTTAERLRYYLLNELLFALYASPTGGKLVGVENPQGHPGGTTSYQRGPHG